MAYQITPWRVKLTWLTPKSMSTSYQWHEVARVVHERQRLLAADSRFAEEREVHADEQDAGDRHNPGVAGGRVSVHDYRPLHGACHGQHVDRAQERVLSAGLRKDAGPLSVGLVHIPFEALR